MYIKWLCIQVIYWLLVLIGMFTYPFIYPFANNIKSRNNPLWWQLPDHPVGYDWYWTKFGIPLGSPEPTGFKRFWISYNWAAIRNGWWRLYSHGFLKQKQGKKTDIKVVCNDSYDGKSLSPFTLLRMKFKTDGVPTDNVGTEFDLELSFQGRNSVRYTVNGTKYWMYSYCKIEGSKGKEFTIGWNGNRPIIRHKTKRFKQNK